MEATTVKGRESVNGRESVKGRESVEGGGSAEVGKRCGPKRNMGKLPSPPRSVMTSLFLLGQLLLLRLCTNKCRARATYEKAIKNIVLSRF